MRYVIWGIIGLIVLGVVVVGGGAYYLANVDVDFKDQQMVAKFKETYTNNCVATYKKRVSKSGVIEEETVAIEAACNCARDPIVAALAKRPVMTVAELASTMATDPEILGITKTCSEAAGLTVLQ
jgi:hypothetical protein